MGVALTLSADHGTCQDIELGGSNHCHSQAADEVLRGKPIDEAALIEMGEVAAAEVDPMDDNRGSAEYQREIVKVLVRRATLEAFQSVA